MEERERQCILVRLAEEDARNHYGTLDVTVEKWARLYDDVVSMHKDDDLDYLREYLADLLDEEELAEFRRTHGLDAREDRAAFDAIDLGDGANQLALDNGAEKARRTCAQDEKRRFLRLVKEEVSVV